MEEYHFPFSRIKQVERELDDFAGGDEEEKKTEEVKDEEESI